MRRFGRKRALIALFVVIAAAAPAAHAGGSHDGGGGGDLNEPLLTARYPELNRSIQSQDSRLITATYDRDIDGGSRFDLTDGGGVPVTGVFFLDGRPSDTGGQRTLAFRPQDLLPESGSPYTATVRACPLVPGACAHNEWTFFIDETPPDTPVLTQPSNGDIRYEQKIDVRGSAEPGSRAVVIENEMQIASSKVETDGNFSVQLPYPDEDGVSHTIYVHAIDGANNMSNPTAAVTFWHDDVTVTPFITLPLEGAQLSTSSVGVAGTGKPDARLDVYEASTFIGSTTIDHQGKWTFTHTFAEGAHAITAYSFDGVTGDGPSNTRHFIIDTVKPPKPIIIVPAEGALVGTHTVTVSGKSEGNATVTLTETGVGVVGHATATSAGQWATSIVFSEGPHTITAVATDVAGNTGASSAARHFTVDTTPPPAPVFTAPDAGSYINHTNVAIAGRAEVGVSVQIFERGTLLGTTTAIAPGTFTKTIAFADGLHSITAIAVDGAGNASPSSALLTFTVDTTPPGVPVINSPPEGGSYVTNQIFVAGTAESDSRVIVKEGTTTVVAVAVDHRGNWGVTVPFANGAHTITARAIDLAGNIGPATADRHFFVGATFDTTPPAPPIIDDPAQNSIQPSFVRFRGSSEAESTVKIYLDGSVIASGTARGGAFDFGAVQGTGTYTVRATATDVAGNVSDFSPPRTYKVDADRPTVAIDTPTLTIFIPITNIAITGTASDNYGVKRIELEYDNPITGAHVLSEVAETCDGCPNAPVTWEATPSTLPLGIYTVTAYAVDIVGNRSAPDSILIVVI